MKKLSVTLIIVMSIIFQTVQVFAAEVFLGGQSIGIELNYDGIMITGTYDISIDNKKYNPSSDGYLSGDIITHVNDTRVTDIASLMNTVEKEMNNNHKITLTLMRKDKEIKKELLFQMNSGKFSTGLYVQDGLKGIGTLTYYNPETKHFAALGHIMNDPSLSQNTAIQNGFIYDSIVTNIHTSQNGNPGEKIAEIGSVQLGTIFGNNSYGIYGNYNDKLPSLTQGQMISTASMDEVKEGKAYFLTVLDDHTITQCEINITHLKKQNKPSIKGISFEITDEKVLSLTNGVIQGMSGSPIIQNGKLIGCVTHVDVNNVHKGYGLYIDWMLENDNEGNH